MNWKKRKKMFNQNDFNLSYRATDIQKWVFACGYVSLEALSTWFGGKNSKLETRTFMFIPALFVCLFCHEGSFVVSDSSGNHCVSGSS